MDSPTSRPVSLYSTTKSIPRSYLREEAESILCPKTQRGGDNDSLWTSADDRSIAHIQIEPTPSDNFPLPNGWARVYSLTHDKWFFANSSTQTTTWVDPRDAFWKKATWDQCDPKTDEAPYGWEIATDQVVGLYFIDHINHINTMDDPRVNKFEIQMRELQHFFTNERDAIVQEKQRALNDAIAEIKAFEQKLLKENKGKIQPMGVEESKEVFSLQNYAKVRAGGVKHEELRSTVSILQQELEDMTSDINDLEVMTRRLEKDNYDQIRTQKLVQKEIEGLKKTFMREVNVRQSYEEDIQMLLDIDISQTNLHQCPAAVPVEHAPESLNQYVDSTMLIDEMAPSPKSTRLERELGLLELKKQIRAIIRQNSFLRSVSLKAREQINDALSSHDKSQFQDEFGRYITPVWEMTIDEYTTRIENEEFSELELKAKNNIELDFKEKIMLLATSTRETWSNFTASVQ